MTTNFFTNFSGIFDGSLPENKSINPSDANEQVDDFACVLMATVVPVPENVLPLQPANTEVPDDFVEEMSAKPCLESISKTTSQVKDFLQTHTTGPDAKIENIIAENSAPENQPKPIEAQQKTRAISYRELFSDTKIFQTTEIESPSNLKPEPLKTSKDPLLQTPTALPNSELQPDAAPKAVKVAAPVDNRTDNRSPLPNIKSPGLNPTDLSSARIPKHINLNESARDLATISEKVSLQTLSALPAKQSRLDAAPEAVKVAAPVDNTTDSRSPLPSIKSSSLNLTDSSRISKYNTLNESASVLQISSKDISLQILPSLTANESQPDTAPDTIKTDSIKVAAPVSNTTDNRLPLPNIKSLSLNLPDQRVEKPKDNGLSALNESEKGLALNSKVAPHVTAFFENLLSNSGEQRAVTVDSPQNIPPARLSVSSEKVLRNDEQIIDEIVNTGHHETLYRNETNAEQRVFTVNPTENTSALKNEPVKASVNNSPRYIAEYSLITKSVKSAGPAPVTMPETKAQVYELALGDGDIQIREVDRPNGFEERLNDKLRYHSGSENVDYKTAQFTPLEFSPFGRLRRAGAISDVVKSISVEKDSDGTTQPLDDNSPLSLVEAYEAKAAISLFDELTSSKPLGPSLSDEAAPLKLSLPLSEKAVLSKLSLPLTEKAIPTPSLYEEAAPPKDSLPLSQQSVLLKPSPPLSEEATFLAAKPLQTSNVTSMSSVVPVGTRTGVAKQNHNHKSSGNIEINEGRIADKNESNDLLILDKADIDNEALQPVKETKNFIEIKDDYPVKQSFDKPEPDKLQNQSEDDSSITIEPSSLKTSVKSPQTQAKELSLGSDSVQSQVVAQTSLALVEELKSNRTSREARVIHFRFQPEQLGEIEVNLRSDAQGHLSAQLSTDREFTHKALSEGIQQLRRSLEDAGLQVAHLGVNIGNGSNTGPERGTNQQQTDWTNETNFTPNGFEETQGKDAAQVVRLLSVRA